MTGESTQVVSITISQARLKAELMPAVEKLLAAQPNYRKKDGAALKRVPYVVLFDMVKNHEAARMLERLLFWTPKASTRDGEVYKTVTDWYADLRFSRKNVDTGRRGLGELVQHRVAYNERTGKLASYYRIEPAPFLQKLAVVLGVQVAVTVIDPIGQLPPRPTDRKGQKPIVQDGQLVNDPAGQLPPPPNVRNGHDQMSETDNSKDSCLTAYESFLAFSTKAGGTRARDFLLLRYTHWHPAKKFALKNTRQRNQSVTPRTPHLAKRPTPLPPSPSIAENPLVQAYLRATPPKFRPPVDRTYTATVARLEGLGVTVDEVIGLVASKWDEARRVEYAFQWIPQDIAKYRQRAGPSRATESVDWSRQVRDHPDIYANDDPAVLAGVRTINAPPVESFLPDLDAETQRRWSAVYSSVIAQMGQDAKASFRTAALTNATDTTLTIGVKYRDDISRVWRWGKTIARVWETLYRQTVEVCFEVLPTKPIDEVFSRDPAEKAAEPR